MSSTPSHAVLSPSSSNSNINLLDFSKVGLSPLSDTTAFKKIQYFSKVSPQSLYTQSSIENKYSKLSDLYLRTSNLSSSYNYGTQRQHNYATAASTQFKQGLLDKKSVDTLLGYNYGIVDTESPSFNNEHVELFSSRNSTPDANAYSSISSVGTGTTLGVNFLSENSTTQNSMSSTTDAKSHANSLKYSHLSKAGTSNSANSVSDLQTTNTSSLPQSIEEDAPRTFKFKDSKSPNLSFLSSEKNVRLVGEMNPSKFNASMLRGANNLDDIVSNSINETITPNLSGVYSSSKND